MRININMDEDLVKKVDAEAEKLFVSRSSYISMMIAEKLKNDDMIKQLPDVLSQLNSVLARASQLPQNLKEKKD